MRVLKELESEAGIRTMRAVKSLAASRKLDTQAVARKFALQQVLSRLFKSEYASLFALKGGVLAMQIEDVDPVFARNTDDIDLQLPAFHGTILEFEAVMRDVLGRAPDADDGLRFDLRDGAIGVSSRSEEGVPGGALKICAQLGQMGVSFKVDVTFDSRPAFEVAVDTVLPSVLGAEFPPVAVRRIPFSWVLADKLQAQVRHGDATTRLKDFYDIHLIVSRGLAEPVETARALRMTFDLFKGDVPLDVDDIPAFSDAYAEKNAHHWEAEKKRRRFAVDVPDLQTIVENLRRSVRDIFEEAHALPKSPDGTYLRKDGVCPAMQQRISGLMP